MADNPLHIEVIRAFFKAFPEYFALDSAGDGFFPSRRGLPNQKLHLSGYAYFYMTVLYIFAGSLELTR